MGWGFVYERREFDDKRFSRNAQRGKAKAEANLILSTTMKTIIISPSPRHCPLVEKTVLECYGLPKTKLLTNQ
jgi:hypothetical protein